MPLECYLPWATCGGAGSMQSALLSHEKLLGRNHYLTTVSAGVAAAALKALGRTEEAAALRKRYVLTSAQKPKSE